MSKALLAAASSDTAATDLTAFASVAIDGQRREERIFFEFADARPSVRRHVIGRVRVDDFGQRLRASERIERRQLGAHLHTPAHTRIEAVEGDVGADVGVALLDQGEMRFPLRQPLQSRPVLRDARPPLSVPKILKRRLAIRRGTWP